MQLGKKETKFLIFAPEKDVPLARNICQRLNIPLGDMNLRVINGSEIVVDIKSYVTQKNIYLIYNIHQPVNEDILRILHIVDALKKNGAKYINLVIPYLPYSKSPVGMKYIINTNLIARLLQNIGVNAIYTFDLYSKLITNNFKIPIYNVSMEKIFSKVLEDNFYNKEDMTTVTIDYELESKARKIAKKIDGDYVFIYTKFENNQPVFKIEGNINNRNVLIIGNTIDTASVIVKLAKYLALKGARSIYLLASHALLTENAVDKIEESVIKEIFVVTAPKNKISPKIKVVGKTNILTELINKTIERKNIKDFIK